MKSSTKSISKKIISALMCALMLAGICFATSGCGSEGETAGGKYVCGVQSGTTGWSYMTGDADWGFDGYANIETKSFDNGGLAVTDMLNGNVDFVVIDDAPAKSLAAANAGTKVIDIALTTESYGIAVAKDDAQLLADINAVLADEGLRKSMGEASRRRAETHFSWSAVAAQTIAFYRRVLERAGRPQN